MRTSLRTRNTIVVWDGKNNNQLVYTESKSGSVLPFSYYVNRNEIGGVYDVAQVYAGDGVSLLAEPPIARIRIGSIYFYAIVVWRRRSPPATAHCQLQFSFHLFVRLFALRFAFAHCVHTQSHRNWCAETWSLKLKFEDGSFIEHA